MKGLVPRKITAVWVLLVAVTAVSFGIGVGHVGGTTAAATVVVGACFGKAYLVGQHFMEISAAPLQLRIAFAAWVLGFGVLCLGLVVS